MMINRIFVQEEGLAWMCSQEESNINGGVLADEMGMGKTLQTIALLLAQRSAAVAHGWPTKRGQAATLVVCPVSAVSQWHSEILRFCLPGSLSVLCYHGSDRFQATPDVLSRYDVVVTSYSVIEAEWRKLVHVKKVACKVTASLSKTESFEPCTEKRKGGGSTMPRNSIDL